MSINCKSSIIIISLFLVIGCKERRRDDKNRQPTYYRGVSDEGDTGDMVNQPSSTYKGNSREDYANGIYCAVVEYYYPKTGTRSTYSLNVEIEDNKLVKIYWSNGGWLDDSHFTPPAIFNGKARFTSDRGVDYAIEIIGDKGGCEGTVNTVDKEEDEDLDVDNDNTSEEDLKIEEDEVPQRSDGLYKDQEAGMLILVRPDIHQIL